MEQRFTLKLGDHLSTPDKKRFYNEQVFTEIAPRYDFITRALSFWQDAAWKRAMMNRLPRIDSPLCLDLACGTGDISFLLAKKYPAGRVIGIDITEKMLVLARRRNECPNVGFFRQDMGRLDIDSRSVDIITGGYALRNAPDLSVALDEINRVLRPGGTAAFLDFSRPEAPRIEKIQHGVLKAWTEFWGWALHRNPEVYGYIAQSLRCYPDRIRLRRMLEKRGMDIVYTKLHFPGMTETIVARKRPDKE
jgi:ubiquinone/menaquinone biosynthesis methyltransferase